MKLNFTTDENKKHHIEIRVDLSKEIKDAEIANLFLTLEMNNPDAENYFFEMDIHDEMTEEETLESANYLRKKLLG